MNALRTYTIHTDGACSGNGGPFAKAGWGAILRNPQGDVLELAGPVPQAEQQTNSRGELLAVVRACQAIKQPAVLNVFTDSEYIAKGFCQWLDGWIAKGWKTSSRKAVAHADLWQELDRLRQLHELSISWVRGHARNADNEAADALARGGCEGRSIRRKTSAAAVSA
ncbi:ribonuclease HI [Stutzerimonas sp. R40042]|uniref:ribonuclease H family protein n=1 Tax=Stutzerimonas TaxID=2901164 RepID=UPI0022778B90|nr:ribonuclease H [Stutzerimonas sp. R40042]WAE63599.1 ribonuclease HI [Stutzerimonas sp. R40042]